MDLSIVVFDLRDAIEELREERAELLKRIEALEASLADASPTAVRAIVGLNLSLREPATVHQPYKDGAGDEEFHEVPHSGILPEGESR